MRRFGLLFIVGLLVSRTSVSCAFGVTLTIGQAVQLACERNPGLRIAKENIKRASAEVDLASSDKMPGLSMDWSHFLSDRKLTTVFDHNSVLVTPQQGDVAHLRFRQSLDALGMIKTGRKIASLARSLAMYEYERSENDLVYEVKSAYFDLLRAEDGVRVQREALDQLNAHLEDARANLKAGTISNFDVQRAETEVSNSRVELIAAENHETTARASLNILLGRDLGARVDLVSPVPTNVGVRDMESLIKSALSRRAEVKSAKAEVELSEAMAGIAARENNPNLDLFWTGIRTSPATLVAPEVLSWSARIHAEMEVYDAGVGGSKLRQARSDASIAKSGLQMALRGISLDVRQSYLSGVEAKERRQGAEKTVELAKEALRIAQVSYRAGLCKQVEVFDAQVALMQAQSYSLNAQYDGLMAEAQLVHAVGGELGLVFDVLVIDTPEAYKD